MAEDTQLGILIKAVADLAGFKQAEVAAGSLTGKMQSVGQDLAKIGSSITGVGKTMSLAITAPIVGIGTLAVKSFGDFNESIRRAGAYVQATEPQIKQLGETAISAAKGTKFSFQEAADAIGEFIGGGISAEAVASNMGDVINLALVANFDNLKDAVNLSELALTTFKDTGITINDVMDKMAKFAADVDSNTQGLGISLQDASGAAKSAGFDLSGLLLVLSAMRKGGATNVAEFGTAFKDAMIRLQAPTKQTEDALAAVGTNVEALQVALAGGPIKLLDFLRDGFDKSGHSAAFLSDVVGRAALPEFFAALSVGHDDLVQLNDDLNNSAGAGAKLAQTMRDNTPPIEGLNQLYQEFSLTIGQRLTPMFNVLVDKLTQAVEWFKNLSPHTQDMIIKAALIAAAMGPVLIAFGLFVSLIASSVTVMAFFGGAAVMGAFLLAIAAPGIAITALAVIWVTQWQKIKAGFETVYSFIIAGINNLKTALFDLGQKLGSFMPSKDSFIGQVFAWGGMTAVKSVLGAVGIPSFDTGGIVPGALGSPQLIMAHGGETVLPTHKASSSANSAWSGDQNVNVTINVSEKVDLQTVARFLDQYLGQKSISRQFGNT